MVELVLVYAELVHRVWIGMRTDDRILDRGRPVDQGVTPFVADPAGVSDVIKGRVHLPLSTAGYFLLMAKPALEVEQITFLVSLRLEALPTCHVSHDSLLLQYHLKLNALVCLILSCALYGCHNSLLLFLHVYLTDSPAVNSPMQVFAFLFNYTRIPTEVHSYERLSPA